MSDLDCGDLECEKGHPVSFTKDNHRFSCEDEGCNAPIRDRCPWCSMPFEEGNVDDSGQYCDSGFCYCSDDYDICLVNRIGGFHFGLELCDGNPWELDYDWVKESWDAALERNLVTQQEYDDGLKAATEYFGE